MFGRRRRRRRREYIQPVPVPMYEEERRMSPLLQRMGAFVVLFGVIFAVVFAVVAVQRLDSQSFSMLLGGAYTLGIVAIVAAPILVIAGLVAVVVWRSWQERRDREAYHRPAQTAPVVFQVPPSAPALPAVEQPARPGGVAGPAHWQAVPRTWTEVVSGAGVDDGD